QTHDQAGGGGFAAAAFTDQPQGFATAYLQVDSVDRPYRPACLKEISFGPGKVHGQLFDLEQRCCAGRAHTVSSTRVRCTASVRIQAAKCCGPTSISGGTTVWQAGSANSHRS